MPLCSRSCDKSGPPVRPQPETAGDDINLPNTATFSEVKNNTLTSLNLAVFGEFMSSPAVSGCGLTGGVGRGGNRGAFIAEHLPSLEEPVTPIPRVITPKVLKEALLALASEGKLTKLPADGTPNLLVFNNATSA
ncbi:hypothetical protein M422DRAFT_265573 [Sphaerobolus stellatus SS14]|uniref:Unplaced genomic scaffold SPHSTscaffold_150, whole genome shotgun sequence n=1 Tax=Sphaerobolus stellatus (strain SS14) TaxID=990650 RepID=A0A0C9UTJ1_SPHS4|nr:hypothetical protein M422DRAFT_265573 [Sphaerobolus stellatus SS14]